MEHRNVYSRFVEFMLAAFCFVLFSNVPKRHFRMLIVTHLHDGIRKFVINLRNTDFLSNLMLINRMIFIQGVKSTHRHDTIQEFLHSEKLDRIKSIDTLRIESIGRTKQTSNKLY